MTPYEILMQIFMNFLSDPLQFNLKFPSRPSTFITLAFSVNILHKCQMGLFEQTWIEVTMSELRNPQTPRKDAKHPSWVAREHI